jgi:uncharacterized protein
MQVAWLVSTPVKGLGLVHHEEVELGPGGVGGDRRFHLADARGRMFNGKRCGPLVAVRPALDGDDLTLTFPDGTAVAGTAVAGAEAHTRFYGRPRPVRVVDGPWAAALSDYVGEPVTLREAQSPAAGQDRGRGGAVSLLGEASVAAVADLDPRRFRMTIGLAGSEPFAEDAWLGRDVVVGAAVLRPGMHVGRCLVTSQDPDTGARGALDVLELLRASRPEDLTAPLPLGVAAAVRTPGVVRVGDQVVVS